MNKELLDALFDLLVFLAVCKTVAAILLLVILTKLKD